MTEARACEQLAQGCVGVEGQNIDDDDDGDDDDDWQVNVRNTGKTALHLSALNNHRDVVRLLLDHDADVAAADDAGNTPLHYAVYKYDTS